MKTTKVLFTVGLIIAAAFMVILIIMGSTSTDRAPAGKVNETLTPQSNSPIGTKSSENTSTSSAKTFSASEVAKHNSANDCWMIVNGKVYDLTQLVYGHSGGSQAILQDCGKDGSVGFNTKYQGRSHSNNAKNILKSFYVGDLN